MRHFWRAAFAVAVAGFALVATLDVRLAYAEEAEPFVVYTLCEQGNLTVCGEVIEYTCPQGGGVSYTYPYSFSFTLTQPTCFPTNRTNKYKDFVSYTQPIIITAPAPKKCTKTPTGGTSEDDAGDGSTSTEEECVE
jgi:hypothetical protein